MEFWNKRQRFSIRKLNNGIAINNDEKGAEQYMSEHMEIIEKCMDEMQKNSNNKRPANGIVIGGE